MRTKALTSLPLTVVVCWRWSSLLQAWCHVTTLHTKAQAHEYVKEQRLLDTTKTRIKAGVYQLTKVRKRR